MRFCNKASPGPLGFHKLLLLQIENGNSYGLSNKICKTCKKICKACIGKFIESSRLQTINQSLNVQMDNRLHI